VIHCDIKPDNILINKKGEIKIADFGISKMMDIDNTRELKALKGTKMFLAPEAWSSTTNKTEKVDIWSLGVTFFYLAFKRFPFPSSNIADLHSKIKAQPPQFPSPESSVGLGFSSQLSELLSSMLTKSAVLRPSLSALFSSSWVTHGGLHPLVACSSSPIHVSNEEVEGALLERVSAKDALFYVSRAKAAARKARQWLKKSSNHKIYKETHK